MMRPEAVGITDFDHASPFWDGFGTYLAPRLLHRADGFSAILGNLDERSVIVETGCLRAPGNWTGDGQSTFVFDYFASQHNAKVWSVDCSIESVGGARSVVSNAVSLVLQDSVAFLATFHFPIDLLYLDSLDGNFPGSAQHHLFELTAAMPNLHHGSIVCVDDAEAGKGGLVSEFMSRIDAKLIHDGYQRAWLMR